MISPAFGASRTASGVRFTLFAPRARKVELLYAAQGEASSGGKLALEREARGAEFDGTWSCELALPAAGIRRSGSGVDAALEYTFRVDDGPELIDPYARLLAGGERWADRSWEDQGLRFRPYRGLWTDRALLSASAQRPPRPAVSDAERVIYELHVRGFTRHPSAAVSHPGTYQGLIEKLPYLRSLGVTTLELLPVFEFDETENHRRNPRSGERLLNYWGYSPVSFFAPKRAYASAGERGEARAIGAELVELAGLVDACHLAGLEVVLDVVYNHTAEGGGGAGDPLRSFRGLAEDVYYIRDAASGRPFDCTGCGNTVNTNHPVVRRMILDSLRYWAGEVGIDGFRFDLASVFYRGLSGEKLERSPIADEIAADPVLRDRLLIAEPWDVTGFFPPRGFESPWRVWNGGFRDDVRRSLRGFPGEAPRPRTIAVRLGGSLDLLPVAPPSLSRAVDFPTPRFRAVDFVTCHDGFTLRDLFSYERKHNEANGENGQDGSNHNVSSNQGVEGESVDAGVLARRAQLARNALTLLLLTRGTPMILAGDELARTQRGNNNPWCQDDETSWVHWGGDDEHLVAWVRRLIALRRDLGRLDFRRHAASGAFEDDSTSPHSPESSAFLLLFQPGSGTGAEVAVACNPTELPARLPLPRARGERPWRAQIDTAMPLPGGERGVFVLDSATSELQLEPRSIRILTTGPA